MANTNGDFRILIIGAGTDSSFELVLILVPADLSTKVLLDCFLLKD
jgi:hypothetical protein